MRPVMNFPWTRRPSTYRTGLPLNFPNHSRSFDPAQGSVSFWGYAATIEVTVQVPGDMLQLLSPGSGQDEASRLQAFDSHRGVIETAARAVYGRNRQTFVQLSPGDF
jgi:hypothetical protein